LLVDIVCTILALFVTKPLHYLKKTQHKIYLRLERQNILHNANSAVSVRDVKVNWHVLTTLYCT